MLTINLGDKPLAGFGQPIEMLKDCHRRIEHFLEVLCKVEARFGSGELTPDARRALAVSLDYFAHLAPRHTADEEESLFPRVRESRDADAGAAMAAIDQLQQDHRRCEAGHALVDRLGRDWLAAGRLDEAQRAQLRTTLDELTQIYAAHIQTEEQEVFPIAAEVLEEQHLRAIGDEMRQRRALAHRPLE